MGKLSLFNEAAIFMSARAHMWHLNTTSYAQHMALKTYYEDLPGLVDAFIEGCTVYHSPIEPSKQSYTFDSAEGAIEGLLQFLKIMSDVHADVSKYPGLTNSLEAIISLTESTIYKLKHLH